MADLSPQPTAIWTGKRLIEALPWDSSGERFLIRDRDGIYGVEFRERVRGLDIGEVVTARASPWQNGYCERVVGTLRPEGRVASLPQVGGLHHRPERLAA